MTEAGGLADVHEALGARFGTLDGVRLPRHYGDPAAEYAAATSGAILVDRCDRAVLRMEGRDPVRMIQGLVSNDVAGAPEGQGVYATMLTPKGKMVADLRIFRHGDGVLLELAAVALDGAITHLRKFVPPLFARVETPAGGAGVLGVYGPAARAVVAGAAGAAPAEDTPEEGFVVAPCEAGEALVARTRYAGVDGYDVIAPAPALPALWRALERAGARPAGHAALEVLRIEAGRPRWGAELDDTVIPLEAGLRERTISETKGCYTGQEVIIRILHRGRVNWHLRGLLLGDAAAPPAGASLHRPGEPKPVARVTSACASPALGQTIALGYVRREIDPPARLRLGSPDGPPADVVTLPFVARPGAGTAAPAAP